MKIPEIWVSAGEHLLAAGNIEKLLQYNISGIRFNTGRGSYSWISDKIAQLINAGYPPDRILVDIGNKKPRIMLTGSSREFRVSNGDLVNIYDRPGIDGGICLLNECFFKAAAKGDIEITNSCAEGVDVILLTTETAGSADPFKAINFLTKILEYIKCV